MSRLLRVFGASLATALGSSYSSSSSSPSKGRVVVLASTIAQPLVPTTVLVHGLDSSKETWRGTLAALHEKNKPALALDLRGHGESPLGDALDFGADALADDVLDAVRRAGIKRWVLVGHSMGGCVAMRVAAKSIGAHNGLCAVIVEDMDATTRTASVALAPAEAAALGRFSEDDGRRFESFEAASAALTPFYDAARIQSWRDTRVREMAAGTWWSDINPVAQRLARDRVLASSGGSADWDLLAAAGPALTFDVHLWVAGPKGTVCAMDGPYGIRNMEQRLPAVKTRLFLDAQHSIHNTEKADFIAGLLAIIQEKNSGSQ